MPVTVGCGKGWGQGGERHGAGCGTRLAAYHMLAIELPASVGGEGEDSVVNDPVPLALPLLHPDGVGEGYLPGVNAVRLKPCSELFPMGGGHPGGG